MTRKQASAEMWFVSDTVIEAMAQKYGPMVYPVSDKDSTETTVGKIYGLVSLRYPVKSERGDWFDAALPVVRDVMKDGAERWVYGILSEMLKDDATAPKPEI